MGGPSCPVWREFKTGFRGIIHLSIFLCPQTSNLQAAHSHGSESRSARRPRSHWCEASFRVTSSPRDSGGLLTFQEQVENVENAT